MPSLDPINTREIEILVLRRQLAVLQCRTPRPRMSCADRAFTAAITHLLPPRRRPGLLITPAMSERSPIGTVTRVTAGSSGQISARGGTQVEVVGRFVGVGIDTYEAHSSLEYAAAEVRAVATAAGAGVYRRAVGRSRPDAGHRVPGGRRGIGAGGAARTAVVRPRRAGRVDPVATHPGQARPNRRRGPDRPLRPLGRQPIAVVLDTCFAGVGVPEAATVAAQLLEELPPDDHNPLFDEGAPEMVVEHMLRAARV